MEINVTMKRIAGALLAVTMLCGLLTGCGKAAASSAPAPEAPSLPAVVSEPQAESTPAPEETEYVLGTRTDTEYTSDWMGLKFTLPATFVMASDEEIQSMMDLGTEMAYEGDEAKQQAAQQAAERTAYEMMASEASGANIGIVTEKLPLSGMKEDQYILVMKSQLQATGMVAEMGDVYDMDVAGISMRCLDLTMQASGVTVEQTYIVKIKGDRIMVTTLTYFTEEQKTQMLEAFSAL